MPLLSWTAGYLTGELRDKFGISLFRTLAKLLQLTDLRGCDLGLEF